MARSTALRRRQTNWDSETYVQEYLDRISRQAHERQALFLLICHLLPFGRGESFRFLDIGAGSGPLTALALETFPNSSAICLDMSAPMLARAKAALARFGERVRLVQADFGDPAWIEALGNQPIDAAVSSIAIHHLRNRRAIQRLYRQVCSLLPAGGVFVDADHMAPLPSLLERYEAAAAGLSQAATEGHGQHRHLHQHWNVVGTLEDHLRWLRRAGFHAVDCPWRDLSLALLLAQR